MSDISLSKAVRSNLLSLQNTADLMGKTQERLATGNKVNSALDNPTNFFTAASLNSRASDMNALMDSMSNGIQTLEAADNGLSAITKTLESMQSTLRQARQDKSFQTASFDVNKDLTTGSLSFSGGAVGSVGRSVDLANTDLTATALGLNSAITGTAGTGAAAATAGTASITFGAGGTLDSAATLDFTVTVDGGTAQNVSISQADLLAVGDNNSTMTADEFRTILGSKVTGVTVGGTGSAITLTSSTTGSTSDVDVGVATIGGTAGTSTLTPTLAGLNAAINGTAGVNQGTAGKGTVTWGGDAIKVNQNAKISFTATIDGTDQKIEINQDDVLKVGNNDGTIDSAEEFAAILDSKVEGASFSAAGDTITVTSDTFGTDSDVSIAAATVTGTAYTADELVDSINTSDDLKGFIRASNDNGKLRIENQSTQKLDIAGASAGKITGAALAKSEIEGNSVRAGLADQFNELRDQLDKMADDASFNGINLLRGDKLTITFNETGTSSIDIQTTGEKSINATNLGVSTTLEASDLDSDDGIDAELAKLKTALNSVRSQSSNFGSNLSIVQNRQDFTKNMVNTLQTGAANLTLADTNEEAANLLALQTRQQLSSTALSMASQSDQAVLRLF
jgi:flagellin-like hook-associated protein FlgL